MKEKKANYQSRTIWFISTVLLVVAFGIGSVVPFPFMMKCLFFLLVCCLGCLFRVFVGPTVVDRAAAITITGMMVIGFCGILAVLTSNDWYIDIAFIWVLQSFIVTLSLAKFLEGKRFDQ
jgi:multicomponent Na+:H+ antiporter subunit F